MTFSFDGAGGKFHFKRNSGFFSALGLPSANEEESVKILDYFVEKGGNFIDTANIYGQSEALIGKWLQGKKRDELVIATKVSYFFSEKEFNLRVCSLVQDLIRTTVDCQEERCILPLNKA